LDFLRSSHKRRNEATTEIDNREKGEGDEQESFKPSISYRENDA
jgi:hypothetical protein